MSNSAEFRLSITRALADQLVSQLEELVPAPLDPPTIGQVADRGGVYQLYEDQELVYVGKADRSLKGRLARHYRKLSGRLNVGAMRFSCLYVDEDLHALAPEQLLIRRYRAAGRAPWNHNGFGSNDPGRRRDTTGFDADHFDVQHPANLDWRCDEIEPGVYSAADLLAKVKSALPYVFRYQRAPFHQKVLVEVTSPGPTADELFNVLGTAISEAEPAWKIVALPGYVIMYPSGGPFPSARRVYSAKIPHQPVEGSPATHEEAQSA